jgi:hypothetical protein
MREFDPRSERATDKTDSRLNVPADAVVLGTDRHGATHFFSRRTDTVTVVDTVDLVQRYDLSSHSLATWVTVIAQECGWHDLSNAEMFVKILAESVGAH